MVPPFNVPHCSSLQCPALLLPSMSSLLLLSLAAAVPANPPLHCSNLFQDTFESVLSQLKTPSFSPPAPTVHPLPFRTYSLLLCLCNIFPSLLPLVPCFPLPHFLSPALSAHPWSLPPPYPPLLPFLPSPSDSPSPLVFPSSLSPPPPFPPSSRPLLLPSPPPPFPPSSLPPRSELKL
ncbi:unnamed protein product [Closterium sp. Naga37s-1]|nr:unnamed protein product [Closterium sp. Naga37s-1]